MGMKVLGIPVLAKAAKRHRDARKPLADWLAVALAAEWASIDDIRASYPSADGVPVKVGGGVTIVATVFNIKGNTYRLISVVSYENQTVIVREFLTHAEYSKDAWKGRL